MTEEEIIKQKLVNIGLRKFILVGISRIDTDHARYALIRHWPGLREISQKRIIRYLATVGDLIIAETFCRLSPAAPLGISNNESFVVLDPHFPLIVLNCTEHVGTGEIPVTLTNHIFLKEPYAYAVMRDEDLSNDIIILLAGTHPHRNAFKEIRECMEMFKHAYYERKLREYYIDRINNVVEVLLP